MGLFSKKVNCAFCGRNSDGAAFVEGSICKECQRKCGFYRPLTWKGLTLDEIKGRMARDTLDQQRHEQFKATSECKGYFALDEEYQLWELPAIVPNHAFPIDEIIGANLLHNGNTISKVNLGSAITRTALLGVAGDLTAKRTDFEEVTQYGIQIITRNPYHPDFYIGLVAPGTKVKNFAPYEGTAQKILTLISSAQK